MDNDALDSVDQFQGAAIAVLDGLSGLAPAAVQDGIGSATLAAGVALVERITPTRTLIAVRV
jgi:hypothetical protein